MVMLLLLLLSCRWPRWPYPGHDERSNVTWNDGRDDEYDAGDG
jgi:hypothetical protein